MRAVIYKKNKRGEIRRISSRPEDVIILVLQEEDKKQISDMKLDANVYAHLAHPSAFGSEEDARKFLSHVVHKEKLREEKNEISKKD